MRRFAPAALAGLLLFGIGQEAEAQRSCSSVRDAAGNLRLRCSDGTSGTLRNNGNGVLSGRVGNRHIRTEDNARPQPDSIRGAQREGSSGRGGVRNNSSAGNNCMSGGLRVTDCN